MGGGIGVLVATTTGTGITVGAGGRVLVGRRVMVGGRRVGVCDGRRVGVLVWVGVFVAVGDGDGDDVGVGDGAVVTVRMLVAGADTVLLDKGRKATHETSEAAKPNMANRRADWIPLFAPLAISQVEARKITPETAKTL